MLIDHVVGGDSRIPVQLSMVCPGCEEVHVVMLTFYGRFCYSCAGRPFSGTVDDIRRIRLESADYAMALEASGEIERAG